MDTNTFGLVTNCTWYGLALYDEYKYYYKYEYILDLWMREWVCGTSLGFGLHIYEYIQIHNI